MTQYPDLFADLGQMFEESEVKTRNQAGRQLSYITARTAMNRFDNVVGPENWWDEYIPCENSVICKLTIRLADGSTLTKCDAGGYAGMADQGDDDKSGYSDAFKRAAVKFGVGRYLYRDGVPRFLSERGEVLPAASPAPPQEAKRPPSRTTPSRPREPEQRRPEPRQQQSGGQQNGPRTGKALFDWSKDQSQASGFDLTKFITAWGKNRDLGWKMTEWPEPAVIDAYADALLQLEAVRPSRPQPAMAGANGQDIDGDDIPF